MYSAYNVWICAMCRELESLCRSIVEVAAAFDPRALAPSDAARMVSLCARVEASVASMKALAAARSAEGDSWKFDGYRSAAEELADRAGMSPGAARRALDTGRRMSDQPEVARAALDGLLTPEQAAAVSDGVAADPSRAVELIDRAQHSTLPELNQDVARIKAEKTDLEARRREMHAKRSIRRWTDRDGAGQAHLYGHPDEIAELWQALDPIRRRLIMTRRGTRDNESLDALDYDALILMARIVTGHDAELSFEDLLELGLLPQARTCPSAVSSSSSSPPSTPAGAKKLGGSPVKVILRVDLAPFLRGWPIGGEMCEMDGVGPIPVSLIHELLSRDSTLLALALTKAEKVEAVYHHRRRPNAYQKTALELLYPTCAAAGCNARSGLQTDHREDWADTHFTVIDLLDRLCPHHHRLKTHRGWALVEGVGKRPFVAPSDPRHPRSLVTPDPDLPP